MTIDALDIHDSCLPVKGHAGVALVPAALATLRLNGRSISVQEMLTTLVMGYEIATRPVKSLHATAGDYHTSGALGGVPAQGGDLLRLLVECRVFTASGFTTCWKAAPQRFEVPAGEANSRRGGRSP